jgi:HK97 family phage major capsid protein
MRNPKIKLLKDELAKISKEQGAMLSKVEKQGREKLSTAEKRSYNMLEKQYTAIKTELDGTNTHLAEKPDLGTNDGTIDGGAKNMRKNKINWDKKDNRAAAEYIRNGRAPENYNDLVFANAEGRTLQAQKDLEGGFLVLPVDLEADILTALENQVFMRSYAKMFSVRGESKGIPVLNTDVSDPSFKGEIAESDLDSGMDFQRRNLYPRRLVKGIKYSRKLADIGVGSMADFVISRLQYKLGVVEETAFLTGSGANEPLGIFTTSYQGIDSDRNVSEGNTTGAIKADGLINALYSLKSAYHRNCRFVFHRDAIKQIRKLKDGDGTYLWQAGIGADRPPTILGLPYIVSEYAPNDFSAGERVGIVGDLSFYGIAEQWPTGIGIQILKEKYALENCDAALIQNYVDGAPLLAEAFAAVTLAT